jgi:hypothetical protein
VGREVRRHLALACAVLTAWTVAGPLRRATPLEAAGRVPEQDASVLVPLGMPLSVEDGLFLQDGTVFTFTLRNTSRDVAHPRFRVFVFDERRGLKGSAGYCMADPSQPGTRQRVTFFMDVKAVTARDRYVLVLEEVVTARAVWRIRETLGQQIEVARRVAGFSAGSLQAEALPPASGTTACDCGCDRADAIGREGCGDADLAAFTCTLLFPGGCNMSFSCKAGR